MVKVSSGLTDSTQRMVTQAMGGYCLGENYVGRSPNVCQMYCTYSCILVCYNSALERDVFISKVT